MRPGIFVSRTREKLGCTCDQIGRTLEPCVGIFILYPQIGCRYLCKRKCNRQCLHTNNMINKHLYYNKDFKEDVIYARHNSAKTDTDLFLLHLLCLVFMCHQVNRLIQAFYQQSPVSICSNSLERVPEVR